jgi:serine/threonine-protein kinase
MADAYYQMSNVYLPPVEAVPRARKALDRALELDPELGSAHAMSAILFARFDFDYVQAEREMRRARELEPGNVLVPFYGAWIATDQGRFDEAQRLGREASRIDPLSMFRRVSMVENQYIARRFDESERGYRELLRLEPEYSFLHSNLARVLTAQGRHAEALAEGRRGVELAPENFQLSALGAVAAAAGRRALADSMMAAMRATGSTQFVSPTMFARIHVQQGDFARALVELERARTLHDEELAMVPVEPWFDPIRKNPDFQAFIRRMGIRKA